MIMQFLNMSAINKSNHFFTGVFVIVPTTAKIYTLGVVVVVVVSRVREVREDVGLIVGPLNYSRGDTNHRLPCTITPFYW